MLKVQVLGKGMIPRGYGLAPRLEPFPADFTLITTIMSTPGLSVNMIHPENGRVVPLTNQNVKRMYETYANYKPKQNSTPTSSPAVPVIENVSTPEPPKVIPPVQTPPQNEKPAPAPVVPPVQQPATEKTEDKKDVTEEKKDDKKDASGDTKTGDQQKSTTFKPINSDERKNNK